MTAAHKPPRLGCFLLAYRIGVAGIWLLIPLCALELALHARARWVMQHDAYRTPSQPAPDPLPGITIMPPDRSWEDTAPRQPLAESWIVPDRQTTPEGWHDRLALLPESSPAQRDQFALAQAVVIVQVTADHKISDVHGNAFMRWALPVPGDHWPPGAEEWDLASLLADLGPFSHPAPVSETVAKARASGRPQSTSIQSMADDPALTFEVSVVPDANGRSYVFVLHLERWQHLNMQRKQGPDRATRWEVQDLFYAPGDTNTPGFNINAHGYRGPEIVLPKPSNVFRILCIGGSTTAEGSTDDQTYPAHLQEALRKRFPGKAIEVINCGVQGLRTRGQLVHLPRFLELQPDLVIGYLGVNDLKLDVSHPWIYTFGSMPPFPRETTRAILRRADWFFPRVENDNREAIRELTLPNLEALRRVLGARGTRLALTSIVHPPEGALTSLQGHILEYKVFANNYWSQYAAVANEEIEAWCRAKNVFYIPTHENFHHYDLMTDWCHTTDEGNRLKAHLMALCLEDYIRPALEELPDHS